MTAQPPAGVLFHRDQGAGLEVVITSGRRVSFGLHSHAFTCIVGLLRHGAAILTVDGQVRRVRAGNTFTILPYQPHRLESARPCSIVNVCVDKTLPGSAGWVAFLRRTEAALANLTDEGLLLPDEPPRLLQAIAALPAVPSLPQDRLEQLRHTLDEASDRTIPLRDMASLLHLEPSHSIRVFKRRYGVTPRAYLLQARVRRAKRLVATGGPLTRAALEAGFYDQSHCIRVFRKAVGITPRQYRAALRGG